MLPTSKPQLLARRDLAAHVYLRRRILAHEHSRKSGTNPRDAQGRDLLLELRVDLVPDGGAAKNACWHNNSLCSA